MSYRRECTYPEYVVKYKRVQRCGAAAASAGAAGGPSAGQAAGFGALMAALRRRPAYY